MNILFLTMSNIKSLEREGIYTDLMRDFVKKGHYIAVVNPAEKQYGEETELKSFDGYSVLRIKTGNLSKNNIIEKGISTVTLESIFKREIKKYYSDIKFDLVIYSTPPITFLNVIKFIKKRDGAKSYLLLKDIFPQNAVDLEMFSKKKLFLSVFQKKGKGALQKFRLYRLYVGGKRRIFGKK